MVSWSLYSYINMKIMESFSYHTVHSFTVYRSTKILFFCYTLTLRYPDTSKVKEFHITQSSAHAIVYHALKNTATNKTIIILYLSFKYKASQMTEIIGL